MPTSYPDCPNMKLSGGSTSSPHKRDLQCVPQHLSTSNDLKDGDCCTVVTLFASGEVMQTITFGVDQGFSWDLLRCSRRSYQRWRHSLSATADMRSTVPSWRSPLPYSVRVAISNRRFGRYELGYWCFGQLPLRLISVNGDRGLEGKAIGQDSYGDMA